MNETKNTDCRNIARRLQAEGVNRDTIQSVLGVVESLAGELAEARSDLDACRRVLRFHLARGERLYRELEEAD